MISPQAQRFYDRQYVSNEYAPPLSAAEHPYCALIMRFVQRYQLSTRRCLEVGCGRGAFQDVVPDYTGVDLSAEAASYLHKPFLKADASALPFEDNTFDAVWSVNVLEHVPEPEVALAEMCRVIRPGGYLLLAPAWHTRPWFADGIPVRSFRELPWRAKLIKCSIPFRDFLPVRYTHIMLRRAIRLLRHYCASDAVPLRYGRLRPNYERFWMSDSDACNSLDPFDVVLYFESRGHKCLSHPNRRHQFFLHDLGLVFHIREHS